MDEQLHEKVLGAVAAYEKLRTKPWFTRWFWIVVAVVVGSLAIFSVTSAVAKISARRAEIRKRKAELAESVIRIKQVKNKERRKELAERALAHAKALSVEEDKLRVAELEYHEAVTEIEHAKNWQDLSSVLNDNASDVADEEGEGE